MIFVLGLLFFAPMAFGENSPSWTLVEARLVTPVSSYSSKAGTAIEATLVRRLCLAGGDSLPVSTILRGRIGRVRRVGLGLVRETAALRLDFQELVLPDGSSQSIQARLTAVTNARERVDQHGSIHGIRATATISGRLGQRLGLFAIANPAYLPAFAVSSGLIRFPDPEIELGPGAGLRLAIVIPETLGAPVPCASSNERLSDADWAELHRGVDALPTWTYSGRGADPVDLVNLVFVGSADNLWRAFDAAGWVKSRRNSVSESMRVMRAIAERQGLSDAPMRTLRIDGAPPDLEYQKSLDTLERRDHLRIWSRPETIAGEDVFASAATRDIGAGVSLHPFGFTHKIEREIDLERDDVATALVSTGCVDWVAYVGRSRNLRASGEKYRKGIVTDSRVAVIKLNTCLTPREPPVVATETHRPRAVRAIRRITLTARNHFIRDNIVWQAGEGVRFAYVAVRNWRANRKMEALIRAAQRDWKSPADEVFVTDLN